MSLGRQDEAIAAWKKLMSVAPEDPDLRSNLTWLYMSQKRYSEATSLLESAAKTDPTDANLQLSLGAAFLRSNRTDMGLEALHKALELDPNELMLNNVAYELAEADTHLADALSYSQKSLNEIEAKLPRIDPATIRKEHLELTASIGAYWDTLGWIYFKRGNLPLAETYLKAAWELRQDGVIGDHLGQIYEKEHKLTDALHMYNLALEASPNMPETQARMRTLAHVRLPEHRMSAGEELSWMRTTKLPKVSDTSASADFDVLIAPSGKVESAVFVAGAELLRDASKILQEMSFTETLPAGSTAYLRRRGVLSCDSGCAFVVYPPSVALSTFDQTASAKQRALATLEIGRGDFNNALQTAQQIITSQPYSADGYILKGMSELGMHKFSDAERDDQEALKRAPNSPTPYVQLGNVQLAQKHYNDATKFYQQALDKDPASSDALRGLMTTYVEQKQYDQAIAAANAQIAKSPNTSNFYDLLATALFDGKKDYAGCEAALRKAIELDKNNTDAIEKLGKVEIQQGKLDQALALYQQAIKDYPRERRFYPLLGQLFEEQQNWDQAKAMYQQALAISPDTPWVANNLAYIILEHGGNVDVAVSLAQTARTKLPNSPNIADTLGWAYYRKGIYESAIKELQEALRLDEKNGNPDDALVHYHLGLSYQKANQISLAREQLAKAVKLKPDYSEARKALAELGDEVTEQPSAAQQ